jgi:RNA ligase
VIDYPEDRLVLIAVRNTVTGEYASYEKLLEYNKYHGIPVVKSYKGTAENMKALIEETKESEGIEGWIIRFDDGHMLKVKGDWYVRIHKTKDSLSQEKNVIDLIVNGKMDDVKPLMLPEDREKVEKFEKTFWDGFHRKANEYEAYYEFLVNEKNMDRKTFAIELMPELKEMDPLAPPIVFGLYNGKSAHEMMLNVIRNNIGAQSKVDFIRGLWYNTNWNE